MGNFIGYSVFYKGGTAHSVQVAVPEVGKGLNLTQLRQKDLSTVLRIIKDESSPDELHLKDWEREYILNSGLSELNSLSDGIFRISSSFPAVNIINFRPSKRIKPSAAEWNS